MSFLDQAISAHSSWKIRLLTAVNGGEVPDKSKCCVDTQCDLGKWIYTEGRQKHGQLPEYNTLLNSHKQFHKLVGNVVDLVNQKKQADAKKMILEGEFHDTSIQVVKHIMDLKKHVH
jgi:hypothetical protein